MKVITSASDFPSESSCEAAAPVTAVNGELELEVFTSVSDFPSEPSREAAVAATAVNGELEMEVFMPACC